LINEAHSIKQISLYHIRFRIKIDNEKSINFFYENCIIYHFTKDCPMKRFFYCQEKDSNKFWNIETENSALTVHFGKAGTNGRENVKQFDDSAAAEKEAEKLIAEKKRKGYKEISENEAIPDKPEAVYRPMDEGLFWEIIEMFNWKKEGDDEAVLKPAVKFLASLPEEDIFKFHNIMAQKLYDIDGEKWSKPVEAAYDGYLSGDVFLYVRCAVVANGKSFYEDVLQNPENLPGELDFESLLFLPIEAWVKKMKQDEDDYPHLQEPDYESFSNTANWPNLNK